jgi:hypothetical protein
MPRGVMFKMAASAQEKAFCMLEFAKTTSVSSVQRHFRTLLKESANQEVYLRLVQVWELLDYRYDIECL